MLKETVTYTDFNGNTRTKDLYFNLTQVEATEFAMELPDDVIESVQENGAADINGTAVKFAERLGRKGIFQFIKQLVIKAYGVKSEDGTRFVKSEKITEEFVQSMAFDEFFMSLISDDNKAARFVNEVLPAKLAERAKALTANN